MQIYKVKNYQEMSRKAANIIAAQVILKQNRNVSLKDFTGWIKAIPERLEEQVLDYLL